MIDVALALWVRGGRVFLQRRPLDANVLPGVWEFPGGKLRPGETPEAACAREFFEETGVACHVEHLVGDFSHGYAHGTVRLHLFRIRAQGRPITDAPWGWFTQEEMERLPMPDANRERLRAMGEGTLW